jgi:hypothetical protein
MSCPEIGRLYNAMTMDMSQKLNGYHQSLQLRYGDPRVYAQQQEAMARDRAAVQHAKSRKTEELLHEAYERQQQRNRELHDTRINNRSRRKSTKPPESAAPSRRQNSQQPPAEPAPSDQAPASEPPEAAPSSRQT